MKRAVSDHLKAGRNLFMLNPKGGAIPDSIPGINALFVDRECTGLSRKETGEMVAEARSRGLFAIIRSNGTGAPEISLCAELEPDAVVIPQLHSGDELQSCLDALGGLDVIAQIETLDAVDELAKITEIPGVAAYLIGPNDLAGELGHAGHPDHPDVAAIVERVSELLSAKDRTYGLPALDQAARKYWSDRKAQLFYLVPDAQPLLAEEL